MICCILLASDAANHSKSSGLQLVGHAFSDHQLLKIVSGVYWTKKLFCKNGFGSAVNGRFMNWWAMLLTIESWNWLL